MLPYIAYMDPMGMMTSKSIFVGLRFVVVRILLYKIKGHQALISKSSAFCSFLVIDCHDPSRQHGQYKMHC